MDFCKPDYENSIVNLMEFLRDGMGECAPDPDMNWPYALRDKRFSQCLDRAQHIFLVVLDGLGYDYLSAKPDSFLHKNLIGKISSVFPTSTAPAISSYASGMSPASHGIFGWFQWVGVLGQICACLPFESRAVQTPFADHGVSFSDCFSFSTFFQDLTRSCYAYSPEAITFSPYNSYISRGATPVPYKTWSDLVSKIGVKTSSPSGKSYNYIYWPYFDTSCHINGLHSDQTASYFDAADKGVSGLVTTLSDLGKVSGQDGGSVVLVTADHGMIDTVPEKRLQLENFPSIADCLTKPLCGEPRVVYCHVRSKDRAAFPQIVAEVLGDYCECHSSETLIKEGWFGTSAESVPAYHYDALGDYTLVMKEDYTLKDRIPGEKPKDFIGMHGGVSAQEMEIPLCWIEC
jgi:hypothetical protein